MNILQVKNATSAVSAEGLTWLHRSYGCRCNSAVFFLNSHCLRCDTPLGYEPHLGRVHSLSLGPDGTWQLSGRNVPEGHVFRYRRCANLHSAAGCNWLISVADSDTYCIACRLNRTLPDLSVAEDSILWGRVEAAKRRVISSIVALDLPVASRVSEDPAQGLAFDFLRSPAAGPHVLTGHQDGLITLNIEEADDVKREQIRTSMREPYRTLVGHFRHEIGHYYWDRLVRESRWHDGFRRLFGDEQIDYAQALQSNYLQGPKPGWPLSQVSAYASIHPWEDWAETWAHYMHMVDTLSTATSFGLQPDAMSLPFDCFDEDALYARDCVNGTSFLSFVNSWLKLAAVMNELCRSMGQSDFYPFVLPRAVVTKLHFIHLIVSDSSLNRRAAVAPSIPALSG